MATITQATTVTVPPGQKITVSGNGTIDIVKGFGSFDGSSVYINNFERSYGPIGTLGGVVKITPKTSVEYTVATPVGAYVSADSGNALASGSDGLPFLDQSSVSGGLGVFADAVTLESAFPAAANTGKTASVGAAAPYTQYVSSGSSWSPVGGVVTATAMATAAAAGSLVDIASMQSSLMIAARTPAQLGAAMWLDAGAITGATEGAAAPSTWPDSSGNARNGTCVGSPIYNAYVANGRPGVTLSGSAQMITFGQRTAVQTVALVFALDDAQLNNYGNVLGDATAYDFAAPLLTSAFLVDSATVPAAKLQSLISVNGTVNAGQLGSVLKPTSLACIVVRAPAGSTFQLDRIGNDRSVGSRYANGVFASLALWDRILSDAEVAAVSAHLCSRYNIPVGLRYRSSARANAIFEGDSLTAGQGASLPYPTQLATLLGSARLGVSNVGISGSQAETWAAQYFGQYVHTYGWDRMQHTQNVHHVWLGTNDLFYSKTPAATYAKLKRVWALARATGGRVVAYTILPRNNTGTPGTFEADRQSLNTLIKSDSSLYDYCVDVGADANIGAAGAYSNTTYYQSDLVHLTNAGLAIVASLSQPAYAAMGL